MKLAMDNSQFDQVKLKSDTVNKFVQAMIQERQRDLEWTDQMMSTKGPEQSMISINKQLTTVKNRLQKCEDWFLEVLIQLTKGGGNQTPKPNDQSYMSSEIDLDQIYTPDEIQVNTPQYESSKNYLSNSMHIQMPQLPKLQLRQQLIQG